MCLGIPGRVMELPPERPEVARVDVEGVVREISVALMDDDPPRPGEWVLIHLGFALQRMTEEEVAGSRSTLAILGGADDDALDPSVLARLYPDDAFRDDPFAPPGYTER